jgi:hypothetical protein
MRWIPMARARLLLVLTTLLIARGAPAAAQLPGGAWVSAEVQPVLGSPRGDFAAVGVGASGGSGFAAGGALGLGPVGVYAEYQRIRFDCARCGEADLDDAVTDMGWEAGLLVRGPRLRLPVRPWLRGGMIQHQLLFAGIGARAASDPSTGVAFGGGLDLPVYRFVQITPSVTYQSYQASFDFHDEALPTRNTDVSYLIYRVGLAVRF